MLTNRHRQAGTARGAMAARMWPCAAETRRGRVVVAGVGPCLSPSTAAYLLGGKPGLENSIKNPRFADQRDNQI